MPKQLLRVVGPRSLLQDTIARLRGVVPPQRIVIVANREHAAEIRRQLPRLPRANLLLEPVGRNTAPCLALAALFVARRDPHAAFVTLPADHAIADVRGFRRALATAFRWAEREPAAVAIGIAPTAPETGYGYVRKGGALAAGVHRVRAFVEKPTAARARRFVADGKHLWNSGMFVWTVDTVLALFDAHLPAVTRALRRVGRGAAALARAYKTLPSVSIDYGLMEKASRTLVVTGDFGWSDVGSWAAFAAVADGARRQGPVVAVDASRYVVVSPERLVALVGVDDLIVVDAPDALLVCHRERAQDVRRIVQELERRSLDAYL
jgi:mannose-1-phosphate guanylyltransferase